MCFGIGDGYVAPVRGHGTTFVAATGVRRLVLAFLCLVTLCGCVARRSERHTSNRIPGKMAFEDAARPASAALVFTPPVALDEPPMELSRDVRQPSAFVGYPEMIAEHFYLRWDDRQSNDGFRERDRYERRAVSEKTGVLYR